MRITLKKKDLLRADPPSPSYTPTRGPLRSKALRSKLPQLPSVAFTAYGRTYKQDSYLPPRPPQSSTAVEETFSSDPSGPIVDDENPMLDHPPSPTTTRHQRKRESQWKRWQVDVLPHLIEPYMQYISASNSLRDPIPRHDMSCLCGRGRPIEVILVGFDSLEKINIVVCQCTPAHGAPQQLLEAGYFACAPLLPSLAVSLKVLDFVSELFLHMAPNNTAWCKATERFLDRMGYKLPTEGSLRKRFGNALVWYNSLKDQVANCVQSSIARARQSLLNLDDGVDISNEFEGDDPFSSPIGRLFDLPLADEHTEDPPVDDDVQTEDDELSGDGAEAQQGQEGNPFADALPRVRPSDYLRSCCPLCFGGLLFQNKRPSSADPYVSNPLQRKIPYSAYIGVMQLCV
ncbi:hypothetical protein H0H92_011440 [Tricholoma furcatifolium]|nr:hypothetical protein H0H92_011440 [Tricholoma furcatifolium]